MRQVLSKVRYVVWTSFCNNLLLEWLNIDERELGTRLYRAVDNNDRWINEFWSFQLYIDHFWFKFYIDKGSDSRINTYFIDEYNLIPFQGSFMVYSIPTEREDMLMGTILV